MLSTWEHRNKGYTNCIRMVATLIAYTAAVKALADWITSQHRAKTSITCRDHAHMLQEYLKAYASEIYVVGLRACLVTRSTLKHGDTFRNHAEWHSAQRSVLAMVDAGLLLMLENHSLRQHFVFFGRYASTLTYGQLNTAL